MAHGFRSMFPLARIAALVSTLVGCGVDTQDEAAHEVGAEVSEKTAPLYLDNGATWSDRGNVIDVCWLDGGFDTQKAQIRAAVEATWQANSSLRFTWQEGCPQTGTARFVRVSTVPFTGSPCCIETNCNACSVPEGGDGQSRVGMVPTNLLPGTPVSMRFWFGSSPTLRRVNYLAVHEFGHMLGFTHEQDRPDNNGQCNDTVNLDNTGTIQGAFDPNSIMNYCRPAGGLVTNLNTALSDRDLAGLNQTYARPGVHLAALTFAANNVQIWHTVRGSAGTGTWTSFSDVEGVAGDIGVPLSAGLAYNRTGSEHLIAVNTTGDLFHSIRLNNWSTFVNVKAQSSNPGAFRSVTLTEVNGVLHVLGPTADGRLWHATRTGTTWSIFRDVELQTGDRGTFSMASSGSMNNELHLCGVTTDNHLWHTIRHASGAWEPFRDVELQTGDVGSVTEVDCTPVSGELNVVVRTAAEGVWHALRRENGSWTGFGDVRTVAGNPGGVTHVSAAQSQGELHVTVQNNFGTIFHTIRHANGLWNVFRNVEFDAGERGTFFDVEMD